MSHHFRYVCEVFQCHERFLNPHEVIRHQLKEHVEHVFFPYSRRAALRCNICGEICETFGPKCFFTHLKNCHSTAQFSYDSRSTINTARPTENTEIQSAEIGRAVLSADVLSILEWPTRPRTQNNVSTIRCSVCSEPQTVEGIQAHLLNHFGIRPHNH